jgi:hypothetical protein
MRPAGILARFGWSFVIEGLSSAEIGDCVDALVRRGQSWATVPPVRPQLPWSTLSGYANRAWFACALSRSWPMFPATGDLIALFKMWPGSTFILNPTLTQARALP